MKDRAWGQLGTSGSGNHFVEFGELTVDDEAAGIARGTYLALLSHSGSRGTGAQVAQHYSRLARDLRPELPKELSHLAWLDLSTEAGQEYWAAMELMGRYAAANHALIHAHIARALGVAGPARHRKPSQLRLARAAYAARRIRGRRDRAPEGRHARRRRCPGHHSRFDGHTRLHRPREGRGWVVELCCAWGRSSNEPDEGQADLHMGRSHSDSCASAASRCSPPVSTKCRWHTRTSTR